MATTAKTLTGPRVKLFLNGTLAGIFNSVSYSLPIATENVAILGNYAVSEIPVTGYGPVTVTCTGFRVLGNGPNKIGNVPQLQDLLTYLPITLDLVDRQNPNSAPVAHIIDCTCTGMNEDVAQRGLYGLSVSFVGRVFSSENAPQSDPGATQFG